ncbi:MAG: Tetratricopeptide repeat [Dehalococcoidia bacterium]|nr:Tetratricopeptide repeat [Dehalococcoidia bacterium]
MGTTLNYFSLLGISEDASQDELEARYQALSQYLASTNVPPALREWAEKQAKLVDEAYAVLSDPEQRAAAKGAKASAVAKPEPAPAETPAAAGPEPLSTTPSRLPSSLPWRSLVIGAIGGLVVLVVVLVTLFQLPGGGGDDSEGTPSQPDASGLIPLDTARVAELMKSAQADPINPETLFELGEIFFQAGEWQSSLDWFTKLIEVDPTNVHALTDIGTSQYNLGSTEDAKATWLKAKEIAPDDPQIHYNLGLLYANAEPPDLDAAKKEWGLVLELAPGSDLAQTVQVHMDGLTGQATPQATPTPP